MGGRGVNRINSKIIKGIDTATAVKISTSLQTFLMYTSVTTLKKTPGNSRGFYIIKKVLKNYLLAFTFAIASLSSVLIPTALSLAALTLLSASMNAPLSYIA